MDQTASALLLDVRTPSGGLAGVHTWNPSFLRYIHEGPGEFQYSCPKAASGAHWVLFRTHATFDDFDARLSLRLLWGDLTTSRVSLMFRTGSTGYYLAAISTSGTYAVQHISPDGTLSPLVKWSDHGALERAPGAVNEMRVVCEGDRIRLFFNGHVAASVRDSRIRHGGMGLSCYSEVPMGFALRELTVWDIAGGDAPTTSGISTVVLLSVPSHRKIEAIKIVRQYTGLGLAEAKRLVESLPAEIRAFPTADEAAPLLVALREAGASAEFRK